ncbi:MAG: hypothetical protein ACOY0T_13585 [Myxococcota bacterium]
MRTFLALAGLLMTVSACSATTGRAWVHEPENPNSDADVAAVRELEPMPEPVSLPPVQDSNQSLDAPRPRLSRTISLGQSDTAFVRPAPVTTATQPPVVVNIVNYQAAPYAGYGYPLTYRGSAPLATPRSSGGVPALGQDWARPPSYGPTFPFRSAPAPAWERPR